MAYPRDTIEKVKIAYLSGKYKNVTQLAKEFGIKKDGTVYNWICDNNWNALLEKIEKKNEELIIDEVAEQKASYAKRLS